MAYIKKDNYPSVKKLGIYPDATDKELGLNNPNLENFSLGNWNSIKKNSKLIVANDTTDNFNLVSEDPRGRPIVIKWGNTQITGSENIKNKGDNVEGINYPFSSFFVKAERTNPPRITEIFKAGTDYSSDDFQDDDNQNSDGNPYQSYVKMAIADGKLSDLDSRRERQRDILNYYANYTEELIEVVSEVDSETTYDEYHFTIDSMKKEITHDDGFAFIKERTPTNINDKYVIEFDDTLLEKIRDLIYIRKMPAYDDGGDLNIDGQEDGLEYFYQFEQMDKNDRDIYEIVFPRFFKISLPSDETQTFNDVDIDGVTMELAVSINFPNAQALLPRPRIGTSGDISAETDTNILNQLFSSNNFLEFKMLNARTDYLSPFVKFSLSDYYFKKLGYGNFQYNGLLSHDKELTEVLFHVSCSNNNGEDLLYWEQENNINTYLNTSYPLEITLEMFLYDMDKDKVIRLEENRDVTFFDALTLSYSNLGNETTQDFLDGEILSDVGNSFYRYQVIQWGDEKTLLTDDEIENTYFFNFYDKEEYPAPNDYNILRYNQEIIYNSKSFNEIDNHTYLTPGVKSIKIVVYRYSNTGRYITETYLVNKNIVINDGLFSTKDFSVFGGANFNFLPIVDNQAIIGGFDIESKYHNSVSKIVKDDNFTDKDYLERVSARDYIKKLNNNLLGKQPGQLDLGQTRVFAEPKDIYDFIGADKLEWINQGSGSLPVNSLATDIFIRDDKCVIDLDPSKTEYSTIQNQAGSREIGILIGDYKINQSEGSGVQKQGIMETPLLDIDNEKQAF